jgi:hypothetical protein
MVTTELARQTKNVDSGHIEAMNSEELGSQMDADAGQGSSSWRSAHIPRMPRP